jgi:5-hydroxyisourate hydrolase
MSHVTTHVLDAVTGNPADGLKVALVQGHNIIAEAVTDDDGRVANFGPDTLEPGIYRVRFETGPYFARDDLDTFYPHVDVTFEITGPEHYHVPLLLSPFAYSTYRGS